MAKGEDLKSGDNTPKDDNKLEALYRQFDASDNVIYDKGKKDKSD